MRALRTLSLVATISVGLFVGTSTAANAATAASSRVGTTTLSAVGSAVSHETTSRATRSQVARPRTADQCVQVIETLTLEDATLEETIICNITANLPSPPYTIAHQLAACLLGMSYYAGLHPVVAIPACLAAVIPG
jgi:hypothetical protein